MVCRATRRLEILGTWPPAMEPPVVGNMLLSVVQGPGGGRCGNAVWENTWGVGAGQVNIPRTPLELGWRLLHKQLLGGDTVTRYLCLCVCLD